MASQRMVHAARVSCASREGCPLPDSFSTGPELPLLSPIKTGTRTGCNKYEEDGFFLTPGSTPLEGGIFSPDSVISETEWSEIESFKPRVLDFQAVSDKLNALSPTKKQQTEGEAGTCRAPLRFPSFPDSSWITVFDKEAAETSAEDSSSAPATPQACCLGLRLPGLRLKTAAEDEEEEDYSPSAPKLPTPDARALFHAVAEWTTDDASGSDEDFVQVPGLSVENFKRDIGESGPSCFKATWAQPKLSQDDCSQEHDGAAFEDSLPDDQNQYSLASEQNPPPLGSKLAARRGLSRALPHLTIDPKASFDQRASSHDQSRTYTEEIKALHGALYEQSPDSTPMSTSSESNWSPSYPHLAGDLPSTDSFSSAHSPRARPEKRTKLSPTHLAEPESGTIAKQDSAKWQRETAHRATIRPRHSKTSEGFYELQDPVISPAISSKSGSANVSASAKEVLDQHFVQLLRRVPGFGILSTQRMDRLLEVSHVLHVEADKRIVRMGDQCDGICVVLEGRVLAMDVTCIYSSFNGILNPGDWFGVDCTSDVRTARDATWEVEYRMIEAGTVFFATTEALEAVVFTRPPTPLSARLLSAMGYRAIAFLGQGSYGRVHLVDDLFTGGTFALKKIPKSLICDPRTVQNLAREVRGLRALRGTAFVAQLVRTFADARYLYILQEPLLGGELFSLIWSGEGYLSERDARFYLACGVLALSDVHSAGLLHRDVKPENLLLDRNGYLKLIDFGYSMPIEKVGEDNELVGTADYIAPEVARGERGCWRPAADWWSLGVTLFLMLTGKLPFSEHNDPEEQDPQHRALFRRICDTWFYDLHMQRYRRLSHNARTLLGGLLRKNPLTRLGAREIEKHPWFSGFDWEALKAGRMRAPFEPRIKGGRDVSNFCPPPEVFEYLNNPPLNDPELIEMVERLGRFFNEDCCEEAF